MKHLCKLSLTIFLVSLLFAINSSPARAQTKYELLRTAYLLDFDVYKEAKDKYIEARAEYLKYKTLVSKNLAVEATQKFMTAREKTMISYLKVAKERLEQSPELTEEELKPLILYINEESDTITKQMKLYDSADDLKNLVDLSNFMQKRHSNFQTKSKRMQGLIVLNKIRSLRKTTTNLVNLVSEQVSRIKKEGQIDVTQLERSLIEAPQKLVLAEDREKAAWTKFINKLNTENSNNERNTQYGTLQSDLKVANQYIKEAKDFLLEIIQNIRFK